MSDFNIHQIDEVVHGRVRLGVMAFLCTSGTADFTTLRHHLTVSDGNLSTHLKKLEDAGYITQDKSFQGRKPSTQISLTNAGRQAFTDYLDSISRLLQTAGA